MNADLRVRLLQWGFFAGCALLFGAAWLGYRALFLDDAFITFRVARNLAEGFGPVFNLGERVEGYTTFLWMLVCAVSFALFESARAVLAIKALGFVFGFAILWRVFTFPSADGAVGRRYTVVLLAASPVFIVNCGDGLETPLFALLLLEFTRVLLQPHTLRRGVIAGVLLAGLVLTRPEALPLLVAAPAALALALRSERPRGAWPGSAWPSSAWLQGFVVAAGVPIGAHLLWRFGYYGALVPNTYYAKATGSLAARLESGIADVASFAVGKGGTLPLELWLTVGLAVFGTLVLVRKASVPVRTWHLVLWLGVASRVAFDVWSGSEWMGVFRFLAPALPLLVVLADEGRRVLVGSRARTLALASAFAFAVAAGVYGHVERATSSASYRYGLEHAHVALGQWLQERYPAEAWVALGDVGVVPFYSRLRTIDLWGLVDANVAQLPGEYGHRSGTAAYALNRRPEVIVLFTPMPIAERPPGLQIRGVSSFDSEILEHPTFREHYRFVREFVFRPKIGDLPGYYLAVFERTPTEAR